MLISLYYLVKDIEEKEGGAGFRYSSGGGFENVSSSSGFSGESGAVFAG